MSPDTSTKKKRGIDNNENNINIDEEKIPKNK
jgi:hypothetical protein